MPEADFYTVVRSVSNVQPTQANYVDLHTHNCDTQHIAIGTGAELTGLKIEFQIFDEKIAPVAVAKVFDFTMQREVNREVGAK